jgi:outer membrane receptor for ferrienterochelin and colicins
MILLWPLLPLVICLTSLSAPDAAPTAKVAYTADTVVVTATRREALLRNSPARIEVLSRYMLATTNSRRPSDALGVVSGVDIEGGTGMGIPEKKTVSLDGLPAYYTLVLVDGVRVLSSHFHTGADLDLIPSGNIERIEVLKGPGSAQYGSNAVAGVVNIITKSGSRRPELTLDLRSGTHSTYNGALSVQGPAGTNLVYNAYAGWEQSNGAGLLEPEHRLGQMDYKNLTLSDKITYSFGESRINAALNYTTIGSTFAHNPAQSTLFLPSVSLNTPLSPTLLMEVMAAYSRWEYKGIEQDLDNSIVFFPELNAVASPHVMLRYTGLHGNDLAGGVDYDYAVFERTAVPRHDQHRVGLYLQDDASLLKHLNVLGSIRFDKVIHTAATAHDAVLGVTDSVRDIPLVVSPSLAALCRVSDNLNVRVSGGLGFRAPSLQELFQSRFGHEDAIINGNPRLTPEHSATLNGNIEVRPTGSLQIVVGGAATRIRDMIGYFYTGQDTTVFDPVVRDTPSVHVFGRRNVARAVVGEADASVRWRGPVLELEAGYTYTYNRDLGAGHILTYYPGSSLTAQATLDHTTTGGIDIVAFVGLKYAFGRKVWALGMEADEPVGEMALADYHDLSVGVDANFSKRSSVFLKASNLLGEKMENYEDVLLKTNGDRLVEGGVKLMAF